MSLRALFPAALLSVFALLATACTDRRSAEEMSDTLVYGIAGQFKTFDPARQVYAQETAIIQQVLEPLVKFNNDLELTPILATAWEPRNDCRVWVFTLRQGVTFHDGTPFNSTAVRVHFERILDPATAATRRRVIEDIDFIETPDDHTVIFHMKAPNCVFPEKISGTVGSIPSPVAMEELGADFARNPVGTGPFRFVTWDPAGAIALVKNHDHWNAEDYHLERLIFEPVLENTTRLILLEQGVLDIADISFAHVAVARETGDIVLQTAPQLSIAYIGFNTRKPPFDDPRVRQAANYAVNKEDMIEYMFFGVGEPARGPFPSILPAFNRDMRVYTYDPEKARQLLAEAGYPDGFNAVLWTTESGTYRNSAEATVEALRKIGINVRMNILDNAVYWDRFDEFLTPEGDMYPTKEGVYDIYIGGWVGGETPHGFLEPLFKTGSYSNSSFYSNPRIDELLVAFKAEPDPEKRIEYYREMQAIIVEDAPWIFAFHGQVNVGVRRRVEGFNVNSSGLYFFENVRVVDDPEGGDPA